MRAGSSGVLLGGKEGGNMAKYRVYYTTTTQFVDVEARNAEDAATKAKDSLSRSNKKRSAAGIVAARKLVPPQRPRW